MATIRPRVRKRAKKAISPRHQMRATVRDATQESNAPLECCDHGGDTVHGVACACERFVRRRPLRSVLVACAIGWLLGRVWKRRPA